MCHPKSQGTAGQFISLGRHAELLFCAEHHSRCCDYEGGHDLSAPAHLGKLALCDFCTEQNAFLE